MDRGDEERLHSLVVCCFRSTRHSTSKASVLDLLGHFLQEGSLFLGEGGMNALEFAARQGLQRRRHLLRVLALLQVLNKLSETVAKRKKQTNIPGEELGAKRASTARANR